MKLSDFDFTLPTRCIATHPAEPRDACRLLQVSKFFFDFTFAQLPDLLNAGDILVFNDSKVIPARLFAQRGDARIELLLHKAEPVIASGAKQSAFTDGEPLEGAAPAVGGPPPHNNTIWLAFARPGKKLKIGDRVTIADGFSAEILAKHETGEVTLAFDTAGRDLFALLQTHGHMPLPPYIERADTQADAHDYQTIYARAEGSVAAPTAGLHFTQPLMARLAERGIQSAFVTLHVGAGTFQPVKVEDTRDHVMHHEWAEISTEAAARINAARAAGGKVVAVGTTALRTLESAADEAGILHPIQRDTNIFITPGYRFRIVDRLVTNFHLPKSTLLMLVSAFSGRERMLAAYRHAIDNGYRFYSYGDACLLDRRE